MRSGTWRGVSKWSRRKDRYIGRLYSDVGKVPSDSSIFRSTGELREFTGGSYGPYWAIREREEQAAGAAAPLPLLVRIGQGVGGAQHPSFLLPLPLFLPLLVDSY